MGEKQKVIIDKLYFDKMIRDFKALISVCADQYVKDELKEITKNLVKLDEQQNKISVEELIANKMEEMRGRDSELNAKLYMLHQDLKRNRLSEEEAFEIFERYVKQQSFDKMVY